MGMLHGQKIEKLVARSGRKVAALEKQAGLKRNAMRNAIDKGTIPNAFSGVIMARFFNVPCEWLWNDDADWPPPDPEALRLASAQDNRAQIAEVLEKVVKELRASGQG